MLQCTLCDDNYGTNVDFERHLVGVHGLPGPKEEYIKKIGKYHFI